MRFKLAKMGFKCLLTQADEIALMLQGSSGKMEIVKRILWAMINPCKWKKAC